MKTVLVSMLAAAATFAVVLYFFESMQAAIALGLLAQLLVAFLNERKKSLTTTKPS